MLKALYDFKATFTKTLDFVEGDYFYFYQTNTKQRNWWHVVNIKGETGFVPSNYVAAEKVQPEFFISFLDQAVDSLSRDTTMTKDKQEVLAKLTEKKRQIQMLYKPNKKPPAPKPPARFDDTQSVSVSNGVSPAFDLTPLMSQQIINEQMSPRSPTIEETTGDDEPTIIESSLSNDCHEDSEPIPPPIMDSEQEAQYRSLVAQNMHENSFENAPVVGPNAIYDLVQSVRKETQLSHEMSKVAVETVLVSLRDYLPEGAARSVVDALLREASSNLTCPKNAIACSPDALRLRSALNALARAANDAQQRGWALHDDANDIQTQLLELVSVMTNADVLISQHVLSCDHYAYVTTLVQYYQTETRWPIRQLLLQAFGVMCGLERTALATLACSQLPPEIARDMQDNASSVPRLSHSALLLSMVLSMADKLPITHFDQLGVDFALFLLDLIEAPPDTDIDEQIPDLFLTLILAYNLQFESNVDNLILNALETKDMAKTFTEKVLLLLNREDDPVRIFDHEPTPPHSVLKLVIDLFSRKKTADLFYSNDVKVMIDIVVRQLADLSAGDPKRQQYLHLCAGVVRNTDYGSHLHRREDILRCFSRIFCEETDISKNDQALVRTISNSFPQYFKA